MKAWDNVKHVVTRKEAREQGLTRYFTGKACKHGHVTERLVTGGCCECNRLRSLVALATPQQLARRRELYQTMSPASRELLRANSRAYQKRHVAMALAENAKRRAAKLKATPKWANDAAIREVYALAVQLTSESGVVHHVDHIVALRCREATGLHVQANLRVVPWQENLSKNATLDHALAVDPYPPQCTLDTCACGKRAALFTGLLAA